MSNHFRISGNLGRRLEELGVFTNAALRYAGLPMGLLNGKAVDWLEKVSDEQYGG